MIGALIRLLSEDPWRRRIALGAGIFGIGLIILSFMQDLIYGKLLILGPVQKALIAAGLLLIATSLAINYQEKLRACIAWFRVALIDFDEPVWLLGLLLVLLSIEPLKYCWQYYHATYVEYRDTAALNAAYNLLHQVNIYSLEYFPQHIYLYGILYPALLAPLLLIFEYPFQAAAFLNLAFLAGLLWLSYKIIRSLGGNSISALAGVVILAHSACLIFYMTGFRPDIPGLFFAILGLWLVRAPADLKNLAAAAIALLIAFHLKQYYLLALGAACIYLFLSVSKRKAIKFGVVTTLALGLTVVVLDAFFELYLEYTIVHHLQIVESSFDHLMGQVVFFIHFYWPFLVLFFLVTVYAIIRWIGNRDAAGIDIRHPDHPLILAADGITPFDLAFILGSLAVYFSLGRSTGNVYVYFGELILPFLLLSVLPRLDKPPFMAWSKTLVLLLALYLLIPFPGNYRTDLADKNARFARVDVLAAGCGTILDQTPMAGPAKARLDDYPIHDSGHTFYGPSIIPVQGSFAALISSVDPQELKSKLTAWRDWQEDQIRRGTFDCIITEWPITIDGYRITGIVEFPDRPVVVYKRK